MSRTVSIRGKDFIVAPEPADFWGWVANGNYNAEWEILHNHLRPEHTFLDLGAWVGSHSLYASTIASRCIAVEPDPVAFEILKQNAQRIETVCIAVGNKGKVTLGSGFLGASTTRINPDAGAGIGAWEPGQQFDIESLTLRELVEKCAIKDPMFIKIDVEGSEEQIFQDFEFFREHLPTVYLETHPWWWRDEKTTWENIRKIGTLYRNVLNLQMRPVDLSALYPRQIIFTEIA